MRTISQECSTTVPSCLPPKAVLLHSARKSLAMRSRNDELVTTYVRSASLSWSRHFAMASPTHPPLIDFNARRTNANGRCELVVHGFEPSHRFLGHFQALDPKTVPDPRQRDPTSPSTSRNPIPPGRAGRPSAPALRSRIPSSPTPGRHRTKRRGTSTCDTAIHPATSPGRTVSRPATTIHARETVTMGTPQVHLTLLASPFGKIVLHRPGLVAIAAEVLRDHSAQNGVQAFPVRNEPD